MSTPRRPRRIALVVGAAAVCCALASAGVALSAGSAPYATTPTSTSPVNPKAIPLGDGYVSTKPKVGYVDACQTRFRGGGAQHAGPWIDATAKTWNKTAKLAVSGSVSWPKAYYSTKASGGKRVVRFDDLPIDHTTGVFPISPSDPAYQYDRNPNRIAAHTISWSLPLKPTAATKRSCLPMGPIAVLNDGVYLYNALDAAGRDAAAHEVQDSCDGHPDGSESYHHHDIPSCILAQAPNGKATLVGYALDGYGIYVVKDAHGNLPTNTSLDACHGTTSVVDWNGKPTRIYHYVATLEYPYAVGCFHGTPIKVSRTRAGRGGAGSRPQGPGAPRRRPGGQGQQLPPPPGSQP